MTHSFSLNTRCDVWWYSGFSPMYVLSLCKEVKLHERDALFTCTLNLLGAYQLCIFGWLSLLCHY